MSVNTLPKSATRTTVGSVTPSGSTLAASSPSAVPHAAKEPSFIRWARATGGMVATSETGMSVVDAVKAAGLDYLVTAWTLQAVDHYQPGVLPERIEMENWFPTIRLNADGTKIPLGVIRSRYTITQNASAFSFAQELVDNFDANIVAAAAYGAPLGSRAYLALKSPHTLNVGGTDPHDVYVVVHNSHDGSSAVSAEIIAVRRENGIEVSLHTGAAPQRWTLRHSGNVDEKYAEAVETTKLVEKWITSYEGMTRELLGARFGSAQIKVFTESFMPTPRGAGTKSADTWAKRRLLLTQVIRDEVDGLGFGAGTAMAVFNATCTYIDHHAATRGADADKVRMTRAITGRNVPQKQKAWTMLRSQIRQSR